MVGACDPNYATMKVTRIYSDSDGHSHFADVEIEYTSSLPIGRLSDWQPVTRMAFRETAADYDYDWHVAPRRQYIVMLDGHVEVETSDGAKREFKGGDVLLVEDTTGRGHRTRELSGKPRRSLFIALD